MYCQMLTSDGGDYTGSAKKHTLADEEAGNLNSFVRREVKGLNVLRR
jgi:hypothetical protein